MVLRGLHASVGRLTADAGLHLVELADAVEQIGGERGRLTAMLVEDAAPEVVQQATSTTRPVANSFL